MSAILTIPNIKILNSSDPVTTKAFANMGADRNGPKYIRIEKGTLPLIDRGLDNDFSSGVSIVETGSDIVIIATGAIVHEAIKAAAILREESNLSVGVIDLYRVKPLPEDKLVSLIENSGKVVTLEEGYTDCGMGSMVASLLAERSFYKPFMRLGIKNHFCFDYGSRDYLLDLYGLNGKKVANKILDWESKNV